MRCFETTAITLSLPDWACWTTEAVVTIVAATSPEMVAIVEAPSVFALAGIAAAAESGASASTAILPAHILVGLAAASPALVLVRAKPAFFPGLCARSRWLDTGGAIAFAIASRGTLVVGMPVFRTHAFVLPAVLPVVLVHVLSPVLPPFAAGVCQLRCQLPQFAYRGLQFDTHVPAVVVSALVVSVLVHCLLLEERSGKERGAPLRPWMARKRHAIATGRQARAPTAPVGLGRQLLRRKEVCARSGSARGLRG